MPVSGMVVDTGAMTVTGAQFQFGLDIGQDMSDVTDVIRGGTLTIPAITDITPSSGLTVPITATLDTTVLDNIFILVNYQLG